MANTIPHFISGMMGRPFQTPFAKPPGEGLSSPTLNVLWGFSNAVVGYLLICRVGDFSMRNTSDVLSCGIGVLSIALFSAWYFGRLNVGNTPKHP